MPLHDSSKRADHVSGLHFPLSGGATSRAAGSCAEFDQAAQLNLVDTALRLARKSGAGYADLRIGSNEEEVIHARERRLERFNSTISKGFGIRVLLHGSWGFASSQTIEEKEIERVVGLAIENAEANRMIQTVPILLEDLPAYQEDWVMPMRIDPFTIPADEKALRLLAINEAALQAGADYCSSTLQLVCERKVFASSRGSRIAQTRVRCHPHFEVTAIDKQSGTFARRASLAAPRGSGWEYVDACDLVSEAGLAAEQAREKLKAKPVAPGRYDLVIDPTNLWLTLHETVGHSTELDRALGWEANFAGTSLVTPEKLDKLQFGTTLMTVMADRSQEGGLATLGFDDDGAWSILRPAQLKIPPPHARRVRPAAAAFWRNKSCPRGTKLVCHRARPWCARTPVSGSDRRRREAWRRACRV
jgi:TldD protein